MAAQEAIPQPEATFVTPEQQKMLRAFENEDYRELLACLRNVEREKAVDRRQSRILGRGDWIDDAMFLLPQLPKQVLRSILDNTFTQRALTDPQNRLRSPGGVNNGSDPGVYINTIADAGGRGIPRDEYAAFLAYLEAAMGINSEAVRTYEFSEEDVRSSMNHAYRGTVKNPNVRRDFFATLTAEHQSTLRDDVCTFVRFHRQHVLPAAMQQDLKHITIHSEVGLAVKMYARCEQHLNLSLTPPLLVLVQLAAKAFLPAQNFRLHQHVLFYVARPSQMEIAESIASQLCASYITCGGLNTSQAGIQLGATNTSPQSWWKDAAKVVVNRGYLRHIRPNLQESLDNLAKRLQTEQDKIEQLKRNAAYAHNIRDRDIQERRLQGMVDELHATYIKQTEDLTSLTNAFKDEKEDEVSIEAGVASMRKFSDALKQL